MKQTKPALYFLLILLVGTLILSYFVIRPFFDPLIFAAVFATIFQPIYKKILRLTKGWESSASLITILIVLAFICIPITMLGTQIIKESKTMYTSIMNDGGKNALIKSFNEILNHLEPYVPSQYLPTVSKLSSHVDELLKTSLSFLAQHLGGVFGSVAELVFSLFLFLLALFFLLKDGERLKARLTFLSPLPDHQNQAIFQKMAAAVNAIIKGRLLIAIVQGVLTGLGLFAVGIASPVLWGSIGIISAFIPAVGTAPVSIPAIIYLFATGKIFAGIGLSIWALFVGLIDNVLAPKFMESGIQLHPLLILLSVLGGISFFGTVGFLLGPLIICLLFVCLDIYSELANKSNENSIRS